VIIVGHSAIHDVLPAWEQLWRADPDATAAQHPTILLGLGEVLALPGTPALVVVTDQGGGDWLAALPVRRTTHGLPLLPYRVAAAPAGWHLPGADPLVAPGVMATAMPALTTALTGRVPWEQLDLRFMRAAGPLARHLAGVPSPSGEARVLRLAEGPRLSSSGAARMRQYARRLERRGACAITPALAASEIPEAITRFAELHTARWEADGPAAEFRAATTRARLSAWALRAHAAGLLTVGTIRLEGVVIAVHLALNDRRGRVAWRIASSPDYPDVSLGRLLFSRMIEQAHADGCEWYAFGRGDEAYKQSWETEVQPLVRLVRTARHPMARLRQLGAKLSPPQDAVT
jgi:CelD/BcsL family acetyltransferase involved in cellulose biosynthesis